MDRRSFLLTLMASVAVPTLRKWRGEGTEGSVMTVTGPIEAREMGFTLPHEHILVDFVGAEQASPERYDAAVVFETMLPYLEELRAQGCDTFVDGTPAYLGRDAVLLKQLSEASGLQIITNTGYYTAADEQFVPSHAYDLSAEDIARAWVQEWEQGIDGTPVRPGFMKIGVDTGPLSDINKKIVRAAAQTHRESGLTIASHTGDASGAFEQLEILEQEGVSPEAFIWVHAQNAHESAAHIEAARRGAWVSFDGVSTDTLERHVEYVSAMKEAGVLSRTLVSQDAGWYDVESPGGGDVRPFTTVVDAFIPTLRQRGFTEDEIELLFRSNPAEAFTIAKRTL